MLRLSLFSLLIFTVACSPRSRRPAALDKAIPLKSAMILQINHRDKAEEKLEASLLWQDLKSTPTLAPWKTQAQWVNLQLDSLKAPDNQAVLACLEMSGADRYNWIWIARAPDDETFDTWSRSLPDFQRKTYDPFEIFSTGQADELWHFAQTEGLLLMSKSEILLKESLRQTRANVSLGDYQDYQRIVKTANTGDAVNVFFNLRHLPGFVKTIFPTANPTYLANLGTWAGFDLSLRSDRIFASGLILAPDSANRLNPAFYKAGKAAMNAHKIWPTNASAGVNLQVNRFSTFLDQTTTFFEKNRLLREYRRLLPDTVNPTEVAQLFAEWVGTEAGIVYLDLPAENLTDQKVAYFAVDDEVALENFLQLHGSTDPMDEYRGFDISKLETKGLFQGTLGRLFRGITDPYYTQVNGYLLMSQNLLTLKNVLNSISAGQTLERDASFMEFVGDFQKSANLFAFFRSPEAMENLKLITQKGDFKNLKDHRTAWSQMEWGGFQMIAEKEAALGLLIFKKKKQLAAQTRQLWTVELEANPTPDRAPQLVTNHYNNEKEVLVTDENNHLYLITKEGKVLWKKELPGKVLGAIEQVDLFKNKKLQLAFVTENHLHMVDRLGRDVEGFPVKLAHRATAPLAVFDYDNNRNYRFVVAAGTRLLNYDAKGKPVKGWSPVKFDAEINYPPQHITVGRKDYIFVLESSGRPHLLNRKGETRIPISTKFEKLTTDLTPFAQSEEEEPRMVGLLQNGQLAALYFDGKGESIDLGLPRATQGLLVNRLTLVALSGDKLVVKSPEMPMEIDLTARPTHGPFLHEHKGHKFVGMVSEDDSRVFVYNKDGKLPEGFPLYGKTPYAIGAFSANGPRVIVTGTSDRQIIVYKM